MQAGNTASQAAYTTFSWHMANVTPVANLGLPKAVRFHITDWLLSSQTKGLPEICKLWTFYLLLFCTYCYITLKYTNSSTARVSCYRS